MGEDKNTRRNVYECITRHGMTCKKNERVQYHKNKVLTMGYRYIYNWTGADSQSLKKNTSHERINTS